jgi:hypothetical protein
VKEGKGTPTTSPTSSVGQLPPMQPESFNKEVGVDRFLSAFVVCFESFVLKSLRLGLSR